MAMMKCKGDNGSIVATTATTGDADIIPSANKIASPQSEFSAEFLDNIAKDEFGNYIDPDAPIPQNTDAAMYMGNPADYTIYLEGMIERGLAENEQIGREMREREARESLINAQAPLAMGTNDEIVPHRTDHPAIVASARLDPKSAIDVDHAPLYKDVGVQTLVVERKAELLNVITTWASSLKLPTAVESIKTGHVRVDIPEDIKKSVVAVVADIVLVGNRYAEATGDKHAFFDVLDVAVCEYKKNANGSDKERK